jgi:CheY-like chemotaxis protein
MSERMNLRNVHALVVDSDHFGVGLLVQMLHGLGLESIKVAETGGEARKELESHDYELCICEAQLPDMPGIELVRWLRRLPTQKRYLPTLVLTGYSDFGNVVAIRDAGAHLVLKKPASPQTLYDRIAWVSKPPRDFVECESYVGPDRRFKSIGPPGGTPRRSTDLSTEIGMACEPNMSQDDIDSLIRPTRMIVTDQELR